MKKSRPPTSERPSKYGLKRGSSNEGPLFCPPPQRSKPPLCKGRWHGAAVTEGLSATNGLNPLRPRFARPAPLDAIKGSLSAAAGIAPPVACGDSPLLVEGAFERTTLHNQHDRNLANSTCKMQILLRSGLSAQTFPLLPCTSIYFAISAKMQQVFQIFASRISLLYTNFKYPPPRDFLALCQKMHISLRFSPRRCKI